MELIDSGLTLDSIQKSVYLTNMDVEDEGTAISLWLKTPDCDKTVIFMNTLQDGLTGSGFALHCFEGLR